MGEYVLRRLIAVWGKAKSMWLWHQLCESIVNLPIPSLYWTDPRVEGGGRRIINVRSQNYMNTVHQGTHMREKMLAMHDASEGAYEAARLRFEALREQAEAVSIDYVQGRTERDHVRSVTAQYLAAESALAQAMERLRMSQELLDQL